MAVGVYFGIGNEIQTTSDTTVIALHEHTMCYMLNVTRNTTLAFDTSNMILNIAEHPLGCSFLLCVTMGDVYSITYPSSVSWEGGYEPVMNVPNKRYYIHFDYLGASQLYGSYIGCTDV